MYARCWGKSESFKGQIRQLGRFSLLKFSSADPKRNWKYEKINGLKKEHTDEKTRSEYTSASQFLTQISGEDKNKYTRLNPFLLTFEFIISSRCYSCVGRTLDSNGQVVSIGYGCEHEAIILHELMHTLGFFHTSSRPDRDAYVIIYSKNIRPGKEQCISQ